MFNFYKKNNNNSPHNTHTQQQQHYGELEQQRQLLKSFLILHIHLFCFVHWIVQVRFAISFNQSNRKK